MKLVVFGASSSKNSINQQLAIFAANQFDGFEIEILDLNDFEVLIYSIDREQENGIPQKIKNFISTIESADLLIISLAEHNGSYSTAFKNIFDWASRAKSKTFESNKMFLLATSPGARGGLSVLETAKNRFPYHGAEILGTFSLPNFTTNFDKKTGIIDSILKESFKTTVNEIKMNLK